VVLFEIWQKFLLFAINKKRNNKSVDTHTTITDLHRQYLDAGLKRYTFPDHNFDIRLQYYIIHVTDQRNISDVQTVSVLQMFFIFPQSGYNSRVKAVHLVNVKPWAESVISMVKFVLKNKFADRVSVLEYLFSFSNQNSLTQHTYVSILNKHKFVVSWQIESRKIYKQRFF
jgi:hypothetical protein